MPADWAALLDELVEVMVEMVGDVSNLVALRAILRNRVARLLGVSLDRDGNVSGEGAEDSASGITRQILQELTESSISREVSAEVLADRVAKSPAFSRARSFLLAHQLADIIDDVGKMF